MPGAPPRIFAWRAQAGVGDRGTGSGRHVWERVEPLTPPAKRRRRRHPGRRPVDDRAALAGIVWEPVVAAGRPPLGLLDDPEHAKQFALDLWATENSGPLNDIVGRAAADLRAALTADSESTR